MTSDDSYKTTKNNPMIDMFGDIGEKQIEFFYYVLHPLTKTK